MKKIIAIMLAMSMLLSCTACTLQDIPTYNNFKKTVQGESLEEEVTAQTVKIGVLEPLTGQYASFAQDEIDGIELARKLFPKVLDTSVELVYADNQSDTEHCVEAAQSLIDQGCKVIIGSYNNMLSLAVCDLMDETKTPMIIPSCTNPLLTTTTNYVFRVCVVDAFEGKSAATYVIDYLPEAIVSENLVTSLESGSGAGENAEEALTDSTRINCYILKKAGDEKASVQIERFQATMESVYGSSGYVKVIEYPEDATDMTSYFERLEALDAQAVFFPSTAEEGERVLYEAAANGYKFRWIGNSDWSGLLEASASAQRLTTSHLNGAAYVAAFDNEADASTGMTRIYATAVSAYYDDDNPSENVALGFDAYLVATEGIKQAGLDALSTTIRRAISRTQDLDAATGSISYWGGNGDPVKDVVIEKIVDGVVTADYVAAPDIESEYDDTVETTDAAITSDAGISK